MTKYTLAFFKVAFGIATLISGGVVLFSLITLTPLIVPAVISAITLAICQLALYMPADAVDPAKRISQDSRPALKFAS